MQHFVVIFGDGLYQLHAERFSFLYQVGRNRLDRVFSAQGLIVPDNGFHLDHVDHTFELGFLSDGDLNRDWLSVEALADGINGVLEIGPGLVHLINEANARDAVLVSLAPHCFRLRLDAVDGVKASHGTVEDAQ